MEWFRDTKSTNYGLNLTCKSRIETQRSANLLLTAALTIFTLWLLGLSLKGTETSANQYLVRFHAFLHTG